jgi:CHAT domain-containing protein
MKSLIFKKLILLKVIVLLTFFSVAKGQDVEFDVKFQKFLKYYNSGDIINSEKTLIHILNGQDTLSKSRLIPIYNNLGAVYQTLGNYDKAIYYNVKAEELFSRGDKKNFQLMADIFNNRGRIFNIKKSYDQAIEYLEKAIRLYGVVNDQSSSFLKNYSAAYLNLGIAYYNVNEFTKAQISFKKSADLKLKYKLSGLALVYLNIAKIYVRTNNALDAEYFYNESILDLGKESGANYYRLAEAYFDYGLFLRSEGKLANALDAHKKALSICLKNYGKKHTLVSLSYKHIADDFITQNKPDSALYYFQKSLIAVVTNFNNQDIFSNPSTDSSLFDIRLLDNLKSKAQALESYSGLQKDPAAKLKCLNTSLNTIELALQLIDRIRNNYMSEESRIYLAENEKETYVFATHLAYNVFTETVDPAKGSEMYSIAQKAKAAILRNEITGNELLYSTGIPDSLREKQNTLTGEIAAYNNLVLEENRKTSPNTSKIAFWKDALFEMNREKERVTGSIEKAYPEYHELIRKTEPMSLEIIQDNLKNDETIIDYLLSNQYSLGKRKLYIFLISNHSLEFRETALDSSFVKYAGIIRKTSNPTTGSERGREHFLSSTTALNYMYLNLFKPVEDRVRGKKLIIIPDEEIGWLPFDSFLKNKPASDQTDYEGLSFLINDYTFSYGYSSSLLFNKNNKILRDTKVFAFSPDYGNNTSLSSLQGTGIEIQSIYKGFRGENFSGINATKENFKSVLQNHDILHLAMHSMSDSVNSKYSYLMFDTHNLNPEQGKLYNYEISLTRIKSPMVVLSACNSGSGTLYFGEGLMSLARGFTLAGASSVIKTAWDINDESSAAIMKNFYFYLSKGKEKNVSMRLAKLDYLKNSSPESKNPYFWAAYEVLGDNSPVTRVVNMLLISVVLTVVVAGGLVIYFRRRRIFSERSL